MLNYYSLHDRNEMHWEIVGPDGLVAEYIPKTSDDDNRDEAERRCKELNRRKEACDHDRLNEDGICRKCGRDCRGI